MSETPNLDDALAHWYQRTVSVETANALRESDADKENARSEFLARARDENRTGVYGEPELLSQVFVVGGRLEMTYRIKVAPEGVTRGRQSKRTGDSE